jgi:thiol-disulfide isomerase/thioredoxin
MKCVYMFLVGVFLCLQNAVFAGDNCGAPLKFSVVHRSCNCKTPCCEHDKTCEFCVTQWVTPNPPTSEDIKGCVCVVEFWATWCPPCRDSIPHMRSLAAKYKDRNVCFIGLSDDSSIGDVRKFVDKKKINYNIAMDTGIGEQLGISGIPTVMIINHEGRLTWSGNPRDSRFDETLDAAVSAAPKPILAGMDLGRFSNLRAQLNGGKNFAKAYAEVEACSQKSDSPDKALATQIISRINEQIREKIDAAQQTQGIDPQTALALYKEIVDQYSGISLTKDAEPAYRQLQQQIKTQITKVASAHINADI